MIRLRSACAVELAISETASTRGSSKHKMTAQIISLWVGLLLVIPARDAEAAANGHQTAVSIVGDEFYVNGRPTYPGCIWKGRKIQGLLLNARLVQGVFDDRNTNTVSFWAYPDTGKWDPERDTREFLAAMRDWR